MKAALGSWLCSWPCKALESVLRSTHDKKQHLDKHAGKLPKFMRQAMAYASSHPDSGARSQRLRTSDTGQGK